MPARPPAVGAVRPVDEPPPVGRPPAGIPPPGTEPPGVEEPVGHGSLPPWAVPGGSGVVSDGTSCGVLVGGAGGVVVVVVVGGSP